MKRLSCVLIPVVGAFIAIASTVTLAQIRPMPQLLGVIKADALFDDTVLHDISLAVNTNDWQTLKDHYLENTYYPADFRWRDQVVRNVGIRSRGTGSRSRIKPDLLVNFVRYTTGGTFLGLRFDRPAQQHAGRVEHARAVEHATVPANGVAGLARGLHEALHQRGLRRPVHDRRIRWRRRF